MELNYLLAQCGLNDSEQRVFLSLLESGARSASRIAKACELKRPTAYAILEALIARGLVTKQKVKGANSFEVISSSLIPEVLASQARREFERVQQATTQMIPELKRVERQSRKSPVEYEVVTLSESEAAYAAHFNFATAGDFCAIFNPNVAMNSLTRSGVVDFIEQTRKKECCIREIAVDGPLTKWYVSQIDNPKHKVKVIPPERMLYSNMIMREGVVTLTHYSAEELMTIRIAHDDYFHSMMTVFEMLWESV